MTRGATGLAVALLLGACAAPRTPSPFETGLVAAERALGRREYAACATAFAALEPDAPTAEDRLLVRLQGTRCLEGLGRDAEALAILETLAAEAPDDRLWAKARRRTASILLRRDGEEGLVVLLALVRRAPDSPDARPALLRLVEERIQRGTPPTELGVELAGLYRQLEVSELADDLLFEAAALGRRAATPEGAAFERARLEQLVAEHPEAALADDALWRLAALRRAEGDRDGARAALRAILATRESFGPIGTFGSGFAARAQLELARLAVEDGTHDEAVALYRTFLALHPEGRGATTALSELADLHLRRGERDAARAALAEIVRIAPDTRRARSAAARLEALP